MNAARAPHRAIRPPLGAHLASKFKAMAAMIDGYGSDPGNDAAADDDILNAIRAAPLSMPASLRRVLPWHPVGEPQDPCLRHMSVGVACALRQLMIHEAAHDWIPPILDEATCVLLRV